MDTGRSRFLLKELILFFIPSAVAVIRYRDTLTQYGIDLILIIMISTLCVTLVTGLLTELLLKRKGQRNDRISLFTINTIHILDIKKCINVGIGVYFLLFSSVPLF